MTTLYDDIVERREAISLIGLGYVGAPIAVAFAKRANVVGFDVNAAKVDAYNAGIDPTCEVGDDEIKRSSALFTSDPEDLRRAKFHIIAVPTPIYRDRRPNLTPVESACRTLAPRLRKGSVVVLESTVYPGVTEDVCAPILERESGLKLGTDFKVGYSPERINPGDKEHRLETIVKIVSGMDAETLDVVAKVYELVVRAGVHRAPSIKVAEAAKVIENSQRDVNIAFMNELSIIFNKLGIDTKSVLEAARTKWNFLPFYPGLVGGHCIGIDPYYLTYKAEEVGYRSQVILSGRRINDGMGKYVAENCVKTLIKCDKPVKGAKVAILGITFKENCPDVRNSKVFDVVTELREYGVEPIVCDPIADTGEVRALYGLELSSIDAVRDMDAALLAVAHRDYVNMTFAEIDRLFGKGRRALLDVKGVLDRSVFQRDDYLFWRL